MKGKGRFGLFAIALALLLTCYLATSWFGGLSATHAASSYCQVTYTITNQWTGGFGANIVIANTSSSAWSSWTWTFTFPAKRRNGTEGWNGVFSQSGQDVTVTKATYNGN